MQNKKLFLKTAFNNAIKLAQTDVSVNRNHFNFVTDVRNISINGVKKGCRGFVKCIETGGTVYFDTEISVLSNLTLMYRYAADGRDFSSNGLINGYNRWTNNWDKAELANSII